MRRLSYFLLALTITSLHSCKKSSSSSELGIIGKWSLVRWTSKQTTGTGIRTDGDKYNSGDYLEFYSDGKCIARIDNELSTTTYELLDNQKTLWLRDNGKLDTPDDGYEIKRMTGNDLELYSKETEASVTYETTIFLDR